MLYPFYDIENDFKNWNPNDFFLIDMYEQDNNVIVEIQVPGVAKEDINVEVLGDNRLKVSGSRKEKKEKEKANFYKKEIVYGDFEEVLLLPDKVVAEKVSADLSDGILTVTLPIKEPKGSKPHSVSVK